MMWSCGYDTVIAVPTFCFDAGVGPPTRSVLTVYSINLPYESRKAICEAAVRLCREIGYVCAGTVEFLVDVDTQEFFFIEVNPRVQVEHTVTEMVTEIDIVRSQILITQGLNMHEEPVAVPLQDAVRTNGYAVQCRITTEDPENHFIPDYGRLATYRSPGGFAIRLDGGTAYSGAVITPYFDSLLVKLTTWGSTLEKAARRTDRALREFRVRGVKTNIPFLENLIRHPTFLSGDATTTFIDSTAALFEFTPRKDRSTEILSYLGDVIVNGRPDVKGKVDPAKTLPDPSVPPYPKRMPPPPGLRQKLLELGPEKFAAWVRRQKQLLLTDTTMRDAHQSLLATRFRTFDMLRVADCVAHLLPELFSLEMWGGATFDTSMRFLQECPWERLALLRKKIPNIPFQMLLRASNAVGYTNYLDNIVREFIRTSAAEGIDIFRIFDSLNWIENMKVAMQTVREETSSICEAAICYTGDMLNPQRSKYNLDYLTVSDVHEDGTRTVFFELNGQPQSVRVADHSVEGDLHIHPKAEPDNPHHVGASMPGKVTRVQVSKGDEVKQGQGLLSLEAMKMEAAVYAPRDATVADVLVQTGSVVVAGDLLVVLEG